jgi:hypothetical protein
MTASIRSGCRALVRRFAAANRHRAKEAPKRSVENLVKRTGAERRRPPSSACVAQLLSSLEAVSPPEWDCTMG